MKRKNHHSSSHSHSHSHSHSTTTYDPFIKQRAERKKDDEIENGDEDAEDFSFSMNEEGEACSSDIPRGGDLTEEEFVPKYSRSHYYELAKQKFDSVDWNKVATDAVVVAGLVGETLFKKAAEAAVTTATVTVSAAKVARSVIALEGPEPLASLAAATDSSCLPSFIDRNTLERRKTLFKELQKNFPDKIPIIVEKAPGSRIAIEKDVLSKRYLVPFTTLLRSFLYSVRTTLKIPPYESIWLNTTFGKNILCSLNTPMVEFYNLYRSNDGFLYLQIREQNAFGTEI